MESRLEMAKGITRLIEKLATSKEGLGGIEG